LKLVPGGIVANWEVALVESPPEGNCGSFPAFKDDCAAGSGMCAVYGSSPMGRSRHLKVLTSNCRSFDCVDRVGRSTSLRMTGQWVAKCAGGSGIASGSCASSEVIWNDRLEAPADSRCARNDNACDSADDREPMRRVWDSARRGRSTSRRSLGPRGWLVLRCFRHD
jgi:hypothetical protein